MSTKVWEKIKLFQKNRVGLLLFFVLAILIITDLSLNGASQYFSDETAAVGMSGVDCSAGTCHYIRAAASGKADGTDWANAYPSFSAVNWQRGHTYFVAGGKYSNLFFSKAENGQYIDIVKATADDHGTNTGWNSAYAAQAVLTGPLVFDTGFYRLNGVTGGGPGSWDTGFGFKIEIPSFTVDGIDTPDGIKNLEFSHLEITQLGNHFVNDDGNAAFFNGDKTASNLKFSYLYIHHTTGVGFYLGRGNNTVIEYSFFDDLCGNYRVNVDQHCETLVARGYDGLVARFNIFNDTIGSGALVNNGGGDGTTADNWEVYGNLFTDNKGYETTNDGNGSKNWRIFNNTVIGGVVEVKIGAGSAGAENLVYNNIFDSAEHLYPPQGTAVSDYNLYSNPPTPCTKSQITMDYGANDNGVNAGCPDGADKVIPVTIPFVSPGIDYRLKSAVPSFTKNGMGQSAAGANVCNLKGVVCDADHLYNFDAYGNRRGSDGTWDRGAYEFGGSGTPLPPPKPPVPPPTDTTAPNTPAGVRATSLKETSITLAWTANTEADLANYRVYVNGSAKTTVAAGASSYILSGLTANTSYTLELSAIDQSGNESGKASPLTVKTAAPAGDTTAPTINITSPTAQNTFSTTNNSISLSGTAADNVRVTRFVWTLNGGNENEIEGAVANWTVPNIPLSSGVNRLAIIASDAAGNKTQKEIAVTYTAPRDTEAPVVRINTPVLSVRQTIFSRLSSLLGAMIFVQVAPTYSTSLPEVDLSGTASDNVGVLRVKWQNDQGGAGTAVGTQSWSVDRVPLKEGTNNIVVKAEDPAGNIGSAAINLIYRPSTDTEAPSVPAGLRSTKVTSSSIALAWNTATDNKGVAGYEVFRDGVKVATVSAPAYVDGNLSAEKTYSYNVLAFDAAGNRSAQGNNLSVSTEADQEPGMAIVSYSFNEASGEAKDLSGNGRHAMLVGGAARSGGKYGRALAVEPAGEYANIQPTDTFDHLSQGTIVAWVKPADIVSRYRSWFSADSGLCLQPFVLGLSGDMFEVWSSTRNDCGTSFMAQAKIPNPTEWHHLAYVVSASGNKMYIDGVEQSPKYSKGSAASKFFFSTVSRGKTMYNIGRTVDLNRENFSGLIDNFRIYDRALSADEIKADMEN